MRKWTLRLGIPFLIAMVTVATLYECSTHVVRGWLRGEAFYDGRPTSYWRPRCDEWIERFDDDFSLKMTTWQLDYQYSGDDEIYGLEPPEEWLQENKGYGFGRLPPPSIWTRIRDTMCSKPKFDLEGHLRYSPTILRGSPDAQAVLEELAQEKKYKLLAELSLKRIAKIRSLRNLEGGR